MLTVGKLIDHLEMEIEELESESRAATLSFDHYDFLLEPEIDHGSDEYILKIIGNNSKPLSAKGNVKYLKCFDRDMKVLSEGFGFNAGKPVKIVAYNDASGSVEFCLTATTD